ncbi:MAG: homoserine O-acetyltransferase [Gammaproteobacteria bacterium]
MTDARRYLNLDAPLRLRHGGVLPEVQVAYETWGELNAERSNAVLICTGLSPSAHVASSAADPSAGWWEDMVGMGKPIDTERWFVVCYNALGSCFGTTGAASTNPATGEPWRLDFPMLTLEDNATVGSLVLDSLGVDQVAAVVGPSMGGMTALAFSMMFAKRVRNLVSISSSARAMPFAIALRSLQRELVRSDPLWQDGHYDHASVPVSGMRLARKLGMITYRSADEWVQRFGRERIAQSASSGEMFGPEFEIESYLQAHANKFTGAFDPNCYLYLSRAMDLFDAAEHGGSLDAGAALLEARSALVVGVHSDFLFPFWQQKELADLLERAGLDVTLNALDSIQGHDSFLVDMDRFRPPVAKFMASLET